MFDEVYYFPTRNMIFNKLFVDQIYRFFQMFFVEEYYRTPSRFTERSATIVEQSQLLNHDIIILFFYIPLFCLYIISNTFTDSPDKIFIVTQPSRDE